MTRKLHQKLINGDYETSFKPKFKNPMKISMTVYKLIDFDDIRGLLHTVGILFLTWNDPRLSWNSSDYEGIKGISCHLRDVWRPEIALLNSVESIAVITREMEKSTVYISSEGEVHFVTGGIFKTFCNLNVEHFPFDSHECYLLFVLFHDIMSSKVHDEGMDVADPLFNASDIQDRDGKWEYVSLKPCIHSVGKTNFYGAAFPIRLKRRWSFIFLNIVIPIILLSYLNVFVFLIPVEAGERISFAITMLLSYTVFLLVIASSIPETADPMPIISIFLIFKLLYSGSIIVSVVAVTRLSHRQDDIPMSKVSIKFTLAVEKAKRVICREKMDKMRKQEKAVNHLKEIKDDQTDITIEDKADMLMDSEAPKSPDEHPTWIRMSRALDKLLFCIYLLTIMMETTGFFVSQFVTHEADESPDFGHYCTSGESDGHGH
ncbi:hypothetical protein FSP39_002586 [Pinctada imbricata]|uniref:Uncharacterized protein n=1 Tax=Pinctada imbricata TaxID=66713 RepID=A0AA88XVD9_PINIB|nr:hypothetical protein FSP39_002586 [Pinctada imbricata]